LVRLAQRLLAARRDHARRIAAIDGKLRLMGWRRPDTG
jgi:hypothetical protein